MAAKKGVKTITFVTDMQEVHAIMDAQKTDNLVIKQKIGGKEFTILEVERKVGPQGLMDNNNNAC